VKNAVKGVLLSGMVLPGLGQIVLKSYKRGAALILVVFGAIGAIVVRATVQAMTILEQVTSEGKPVDEETIVRVVNQATTSSDYLLYNLSILLIVICWVIGMVDAYLTGKKVTGRTRRRFIPVREIS